MVRTFALMCLKHGFNILYTFNLLQQGFNVMIFELSAQMKFFLHVHLLVNVRSTVWDIKL